MSSILLDCIVRNGGYVVGVITSEDTKINSDYCDLSVFCQNHSIKFLKVRDINANDSINWIKFHDPDVIFCFGWSRLLNNSLLSIPPLGVIGFHPARLPQNRGRHPLIWALVLGLDSTASTFFQMDTEPDNGDIISQVEVEIKYEDDAQSLYDKISHIAQQQVVEILNMLENHSLVQIKQDSIKSNSWRKRTEFDGKIDWRLSSTSIYNLVRALAKPYIGAHFSFREKNYKVWKCCEIKVNQFSNIEPGKLLDYNDGRPIIKCGDGAIELVETEPIFADFKENYL